jgi:hypothetical protein
VPSLGSASKTAGSGAPRCATHRRSRPGTRRLQRRARSQGGLRGIRPDAASAQRRTTSSRRHPRPGHGPIHRQGRKTSGRPGRRASCSRRAGPSSRVASRRPAASRIARPPTPAQRAATAARAAAAGCPPPPPPRVPAPSLLDQHPEQPQPTRRETTSNKPMSLRWAASPMSGAPSSRAAIAATDASRLGASRGKTTTARLTRAPAVAQGPEQGRRRGDPGRGDQRESANRATRAASSAKSTAATGITTSSMARRKGQRGGLPARSPTAAPRDQQPPQRAGPRALRPALPDREHPAKAMESQWRRPPPAARCAPRRRPCSR